MKRGLILLALVVAAQTLLLAGMVAKRQWTLETGTPVLLKTEPVDPRSLFRGDYVNLNYEIDTLDPAALEGDDEFNRHDDIFVVLRRGTEFWEPVSIHHARPQSVPEGTVAIRGEVRYSGSWIGAADRAGLSVGYGIENYFVPEGKGRELEAERNAGKVSILVAVDKFGGSAIKAILVDGTVRHEEGLF